MLEPSPVRCASFGLSRRYGVDVPKPSDFFIGVMELFAVLIPGALLTGLGVSWALHDGGPVLAASAARLGTSTAVRWIAFTVAAYVLGHVLSALGGLLLDPIYDVVYRDWWIERHNKKKAKRYRLMVESSKTLARTEWSDALGQQMTDDDQGNFNTYSWSRARVIAAGNAGATEIERTQADSKFFRSFVLVLLAGLIFVGFIGSLVLSGHRALEAAVLLGLLLLAVWRYFALRLSAIVLAYEHYLQLHVASPETGDDDD